LWDVLQWKLTDVSGDHTASIFRVEENAKKVSSNTHTAEGNEGSEFGSGNLIN
jgi:hypothetical protein